MIYRISDMNGRYPTFVADAMAYPWTWVRCGVCFYARYIPEKGIVETERRIED